MHQLVLGLLAHVDAGKTTLAEELLARSGAIRVRGRVDAGSSHLDTDAMERERGITIFASQASLTWGDMRVTLVDAPGHVDFSAEAERTLQALDAALLVVGANDGVQGHTETLWDLLERHALPTFVFVNKMDLEHSPREDLLQELRGRLSGACLDAGELLDGGPALEDAAATDEAALEEYLETGALATATLRRLVTERKVAPVLFGSALVGEGSSKLLDALAELAPRPAWSPAFAARVWRVSRGARGERLAWLKVTGGTLRAKMPLEGTDRGQVWAEKVNEVRLYQGDAFEPVTEAPAGSVVAATGLAHVVPGSVLGAEPASAAPVLAPVLSYQVLPAGVGSGEAAGSGTDGVPAAGGAPATGRAAAAGGAPVPVGFASAADAHAVVVALRELADEDPMLGVRWDPDLQEVHVQLMGEVQREVVQRLLAERYGLAVGFGPGGILYRETIAAPVDGAGHFEPLRHYAEVHLTLEPMPRGAGMAFGTRCSTDDLALNWQRLVLTHAMEREHRGVLTGAPLTDVRITLTGGRAHAKHTEGGDFRQATYRAIRQALMKADSMLLEPWYRFRLVVPAERVGHALADLQRMAASFDAPETRGDMAELTGDVPASEVGEYALEVARYTGGRGRFSLEFAGYRPCHNAEGVIAAAAYDPRADLPNTPDSVFCSHGAGYNVPWDEVDAHAHVRVDPARLRPWTPAEEMLVSRP